MVIRAEINTNHSVGHASSLTNTDDEKLNNHANAMKQSVSKDESRMAAQEDAELTPSQQHSDCSATLRTISLRDAEGRLHSFCTTQERPAQRRWSWGSSGRGGRSAGSEEEGRAVVSSPLHLESTVGTLPTCSLQHVRPPWHVPGHPMWIQQEHRAPPHMDTHLP